MGMNVEQDLMDCMFRAILRAGKKGDRGVRCQKNRCQKQRGQALVGFTGWTLSKLCWSLGGRSDGRVLGGSDVFAARGKGDGGNKGLCRENL